MAEKYSAEWVREQANGKCWLDSHDCTLCRRMVGYIIDGDDVRFRSACGCAWEPDRPSSFQDIADFLAMQRSDEIRDNIMSGLREAVPANA